MRMMLRDATSSVNPAEPFDLPDRGRWRVKCLAAAILLVVGAPRPASARDPHQVDADWGAEIVVTAPDQGPKLWRIRKGTATIVVLGTVAPLPVSMKWIRWKVRREIERSNTVLISSESEAGLIWMSAWRRSYSRLLHQPKGRRLLDELPPDLSKGLREATLASGQVDARYEDLRPAVAGMLMLYDWRQKSRLTNASVQTWILELARKRRIRSRRISQASLLPTLDVVARTDPDSQRQCLALLVSTVLHERDDADAQANAWAAGDLSKVRASYHPQPDCSHEVQGDLVRRQTAIARWEGLLDAALKKHGQTFAAVDIADLMRPDGLLSRFRGKGAIIEQPDDVPRPAGSADLLDGNKTRHTRQHYDVLASFLLLLHSRTTEKLVN